MKKLFLCLGLTFSMVYLQSCASSPARQSGPVVQVGLPLSRVELYRNGIGYFEREGKVEGNQLIIKVRKDQINDLLKSLTVIDKGSGKVLSVSLPLDPQSWQNIAQAHFTNNGSDLAQLLQAMRGHQIRISHQGKSTQGRILMVEYPEGHNAQLSLLDNDFIWVIPLHEIKGILLMDGDVALHLHHNLDAGMGEGLFQQVEVTVRLSEARSGNVLLSYVSEAPRWKPTYRLVLDSRDTSQALLQAWAVVDNTSGENWEQVQLSLTAGAPLAFRYNLHTPQTIDRPDLTRNQAERQAQVIIERNLPTARMEDAPPPSAATTATTANRKQKRMASARAMVAELDMEKPSASAFVGDGDYNQDSAPETAPRNFQEELAASVQEGSKAARVAGLTQFRLQNPITLPNGSASMVALINRKIPGRQYLFFNPGGSGRGYEHNPYRVARFRNDTEFALESGPLSVYADGAFVGEGISDIVASRAVSTIPFAVEPGVTVHSEASSGTDNFRLVSLVGGVFTAETFERRTTNWLVRGQLPEGAYRVLVKQPKALGRFTIKSNHPGLEDAQNHWIIPILVPAQTDSVRMQVIEESPVQRSFKLWDGEVPRMLDLYLSTGQVAPETLEKLRPLASKRQEVASIDTRLKTLREQQKQMDSRLGELRKNLEAIAKDTRALDLRTRLSRDLEEFTLRSNAQARQIVELQEQRMRLTIELENLVKEITIQPPKS